MTQPIPAAANASLMERPILFSAPMVRAILAGTKTQTRRVMAPQFQRAASIGPRDEYPGEWEQWIDGERYPSFHCPHGVPGDRLWVRETGLWSDVGFDQCVAYCADGEPDQSWVRPIKWRPSIFMPRWASRITLEVTAVRVERLQDISDRDADAEGVEEMDGILGESALLARAKAMGQCATDSSVWYAELWDSINGKSAPWASNPWVWCISFRRSGSHGHK